MRVCLTFLLTLSVPFLASGQQLPTILSGDDPPRDPCIVINRKNPDNRVVAASPDEFWVSADGGKTWTASSVYPDSPEVIGGHLLGSDRKGTMYNFYVTSKGESTSIAVQQSKDEGRSWEPLGQLESPGASHLRLGINSKGNEVILTWTSCAGNESHVMMSRTKDGKKWTDPIKMNVTPGDCANGEATPRAAGAVVSSDGYLLVAWSANEKLHLDRSLDKGGFWLTNDIEIGDHAGGWNLEVPGWKQAAGMPELKIDNSEGRYNGSLFLVWADQRNEEGSGVWFRRSINFGDNWTTAVRLHDETDGYQFAPAMVVDQTSGNIFIVYYHMNEERATDVYLAWSVDNGNTFSHTRISDNVFSADEKVDMGQTIGIDAHQGIITPVWTIVQDGKPALATTSLRFEDLRKEAAAAESK